MEDTVERSVIHELGRVLSIHLRDVVHHGARHIIQVVGVPGLLKSIEQHAGRRAVLTADHAVGISRACSAQLDRGEAVEGDVGGDVNLRTPGGWGHLHRQGRRQTSGALERFERRLFPNPLGALRRDGLLRQLVAQANFQVGAAHTPLAVEARDIELALFFLAALAQKGR